MGLEGVRLPPVPKRFSLVMMGVMGELCCNRQQAHSEHSQRSQDRGRASLVTPAHLYAEQDGHHHKTVREGSGCDHERPAHRHCWDAATPLKETLSARAIFPHLPGREIRLDARKTLGIRGFSSNLSKDFGLGAVMGYQPESTASSLRPGPKRLPRLPYVRSWRSSKKSRPPRRRARSP
jgi:hypothetical protein